MPKELKSQRIQLLLSPSELRRIDDWRYENRVSSRGEAIRQLIARGFETRPKPRRRSAEDIDFDIFEA